MSRWLLCLKKIDSGKLFALGLILIILHIVNFFCEQSRLFANEENSANFILECLKRFDLDLEYSLPTLYSFGLFVSAAFLLYGISNAQSESQKKMVKYWRGLSIVFLFLSVDELLSIHERVSLNIQTYFRSTGYLFFPWVIPYTILLALLSVAYKQFIVLMYPATRFRFLCAGSIFVLGAVVIETFEASLVYQYGSNAVSYKVLSTIEESLELFGLLFFVRGLMLELDRLEAVQIEK